MVYNVVILVVLLYESKILVVKDTMMMVLEGFNHRITRQIAVMKSRKGDSGEWEWALVDAVLDITELCLTS